MSTDQAVDLFDRLVGAMFRKAEGRHARAFQTDARAINEKVRLYARVGAAVIAARDDKQDAYNAIIALMPWEKFRTSVAEAAVLARPEEFDTYQDLVQHYVGIRRWSPAFLAAFEFESVPASASLMRAIEMLREGNCLEMPVLPQSAPTGFVRQRWVPHVLPGGTIDRRYYELCVLSELRDRLRAGDVWVAGSRQYRSFEELHARVHAQFADAYDDCEVMRNELDLADRLHTFANAIELGDHTISDDVDVRREAFSCAAWLQDLHPIMQKVIAEREDARSARPAKSG